MTATPGDFDFSFDFDRPESFSYAVALREAAQGQRRGERTRAEICVAACHLLDRESLFDLKVSAICKAAKVAHGTFYIYFSDRHVLVSDLTLGFVGFVQQAMLAVAEANSDSSIRATTAAYFMLFEQNPGLMKCLVHNIESFPEAQEAFQKLNREWITTVVTRIERRLARDGKQNDISHEELMRRAYALGGMTDQYLSGLLLIGDPTLVTISQGREAVIDTLSLLWQRGLEP
ncbi:TetR/AcrR family transcriptional regulator [Thalassospira sp.]|uniref:TetR/AcrR family transcriptional regulator n=1 Tax=Thalassospira sp. TaxID=1912094 RepID=UPI0025F52BF4|nr:TetR/AcrR family transcriptional regulator [Thalassospira sp.]|tara:strand:+ start:3414 stop:4109 length:696 start_codon:yes stop_codon:yes gene_type:complete